MTTAASTTAPTGGDTGDISGRGATAQPPPPQQPQQQQQLEPSTTEDVATGSITKTGTSGQASLRVSRSSTGTRIALLDNTAGNPRTRSKSPSSTPSRSSSESQRSGDGGHGKYKSRIRSRQEGEGHREVLRKAIAERRYKKWSLGPDGEEYYDESDDENGEEQRKEPPDERADGVVVERAPAEEVFVDGDSNESANGSAKNGSLSKTGTIKSKLKSAIGRSSNTGESSQTNGQRVHRKGPHGEDTVEIAEIDVLYENQRGWFVCGIPLFSSKSLLNFDPAPWQNHLFHDSAVSIVDAQVPDPSWTWAWKSWYVDMTTDVDEEGWAYSFSFSPAFAWHGNHVWFHSFVRRRRWLRKRVKLPEDVQRKRGVADGSINDDDATATSERTGHRLNTDYFTIHSKKSWHANRGKRRNDDRDGYSRRRRLSMGSQDTTDDIDKEIRDVATLLKVVKTARLDREKIETVMNFVQNADDELQYLPDQVPNLMNQMIFQASRRQLVAQLSSALSASPDNKKLEAVLAVADAEVKRLEFWSDLKDAVVTGDTVKMNGDGLGISGAGKGKERAP